MLTCKLLLVALVSSSRYNFVPSFVVNCYILRLTRGSTKSGKSDDTQHFIWHSLVLIKSRLLQLTRYYSSWEAQLWGMAFRDLSRWGE